MIAFDRDLFETGNPFYIGRLAHSDALLNFDQTFLGRSIIVPRVRADNLEALDDESLVNIMKDVVQFARLLKLEFNSELINYASLGNEVSELHWHLIPRYEGDQNMGRPPWPVIQSRLVDALEARELSDRIRRHL